MSISINQTSNKLNSKIFKKNYKNLKTVDYYMNLPYTVVIQPYKNNLFCAYLQEIPAIKVLGESRVKALCELDEVKKEWFTFALEKGIDIPMTQQV